MVAVEQATIKQRMHSVGGVKEPQQVLIPTVAMLVEKIAAVPAGRYRALSDIRAELAHEHGTDITCPITTQKHIRTIAEASHAAFAAGETDVAPFWRVVDADKPNARQLAGGVAFIETRRNAEHAG